MKLAERTLQAIDFEFESAKTDPLHQLEASDADWSQQHHVTIRVEPEALTEG